MQKKIKNRNIGKFSEEMLDKKKYKYKIMNK